MARDPRYDVLFEPIQLGPVTARNRFFQVPHCNGMGRVRRAAMAEMRGMKAEGGWAVVCTEEVQCYWGSEIVPFVEGSLIDEDDLPMHELMVEKVQAHGSLAGCELVHSGHHTANLEIRSPPLDDMSIPVTGPPLVQALSMSPRDIADL